MSTKKYYSPELKRRILQEWQNGTKSLAQLASENGVHPEAIRKWKYKTQKEAIAPDSNGAKAISEVEHHRICAAYEQKLEQLYAEIGKLTTEINWLKKKFPGLSEKRE